jgi:predicted dehydrogenase
METVRWGMIGCGEVTETKSGPGFYKAENSALVAVMARNRDKAVDYARRHGVTRVYERAADLIQAPEVDAVYVATPPSSHLEFGLMVAAVGKPCLMEKPMAMNYAECVRMNDAFRSAQVPLFVAYYRRALPRFLKVRQLLKGGAIGTVTAAQITVSDRLAALSMSGGERAKRWRFDPAIAGAGLFLDLGSHCIDLLDFFLGPITRVCGYAVNTGHTYMAEDVTVACFEFESAAVGVGIWNFNADHAGDGVVFTGSDATLYTPVFTDGDIVLRKKGAEETFVFRNPPHVHQPLIQSVVDQLLGRGQCESTGDSGARASWAMDQCIATFYAQR